MATFLKDDHDSAALAHLIRSAKESVVGIGTAFAFSMSACGDLIRQRMWEGIRFKFLCLSPKAQLQIFAPRSGLTPDELKSCVDASLAALEKMKASAPATFSYYLTDHCPPYRIIVADPESEKPRGILVSKTVGAKAPGMKAVYQDDLPASEFASEYSDALERIRDQLQRNVFVIHGHDAARLRELEELLREWGVQPVVMADKAAGGSTTVIEKLERIASGCGFAIALFTPDDRVVRHGEEYLQPRGNVLIEVGWFYSALSRSRVLLLMDKRLPPVDVYGSDLSGVHAYSFEQSVRELHKPLRDELAMADIIL